MKQFFIIMAMIVASLCSCSNGSKIVILAAEEGEYNNVEIGTVSLVELNFIASFLNNAIRESGVLTSEEVWAQYCPVTQTERDEI